MASYLENSCLYKHKQVLTCDLATLGSIYYDELSKGAKCAPKTLSNLTLGTALFELIKCEVLPSKYPTLLYAGVNPDNMSLSGNDASWVSAILNGGFYTEQVVPTGDDSSIEFTVVFTSANLSTKVGLVEEANLAEFSVTADYNLLAYYLLFDATGNVDLFKDGTTSVSPNLTTYSTGDKFKLVIDDDLILKVYKNNTLIYTWDTLDEDDVYHFSASFNNNAAFAVNDVTVLFDTAPVSMRCELTGDELCTIIDYIYKLTRQADFV